MQKHLALKTAYLLALALFFQTSLVQQSFAQKKSQAKPSSAPAAQSAQAPAKSPLSQEYIVQNLRAFTKLYGYVRYFHPSDEATRVDWNKFAIYGVNKVKNAPNQEALKTTLEELFLPIAPTLQILKKGEKPKTDAVPGNIAQHQVVSWQHKGMGLGVVQNQYTMYKSIRLNRDNVEPSNNAETFGTILQTIGYNSTRATLDLENLRGKQIKMTGALKVFSPNNNGTGHLWLRVDKSKGRGFFDNMQDRPAKTNQWAEYSIIGTVDSAASGISFGPMLIGKGNVFADDIRLFTRTSSLEEWKPFVIENGSFEQYQKQDEKTTFGGWSSRSSAYTFTPRTEAYHGATSILIKDKSQDPVIFRGELFSSRPQTSETLLKELGNGVYCALPVALYAADSLSATLGSSTQSTAAFSQLITELSTIKSDSASIEQEATRLANVVMAWNVLQHSYPYFDVIGTNWNDVLTNTLAKTLQTTSGEEFAKVMRSQLTEKLRDGHADYSYYPRQMLYLPIKAQMVEGQLVVIASQDSALKRGDVLQMIDGKDVKTLVAEEEALISGTPQWKRSQAPWKMLYGTNGEALIRINRGGEEMNVRAMRLFGKRVEEYPAFKQIRGAGKTDAVWYVDLSQIELKEFSSKLSEFAEAKGLIFDLRGYPNSNHNILSYLTDTPLRSAQWNIPQILYPDQERIAGYDTTGRWTLFPMGPRMKGKIVFLTGGGAISYAESVMGIVEHYKLGEIVGEATAGANGNVNSMKLLGNTSIRWTGMKVLKHDGSQHHLVGIKPTVPAACTIKGVQEGRDEVLEKALSLIP